MLLFFNGLWRNILKARSQIFALKSLFHVFVTLLAALRVVERITLGSDHRWRNNWCNIIDFSSWVLLSSTHKILRNQSFAEIIQRLFAHQDILFHVHLIMFVSKVIHFLVLIIDKQKLFARRLCEELPEFFLDLLLLTILQFLLLLQLFELSGLSIK